MNILKRISDARIIPVVVIDDAAHAVPTAQAMFKGGVDVMEITFRTAAAPDAIRSVSQGCPDMLVGAGTVLTLAQCKQAVECGAHFIVSPGFDEEVVRWCMEHDIAVVPGCVTPTEIMAAMKLGLHILKFFPANVYGGLNAMKALSGPFGNIQFIPTGGIHAENVGEYIAAPYVYAVGGSWICPKADIAIGAYDRISFLCAEARKNILGFEFAHIGINCPSADASTQVCAQLSALFDLPVKKGHSSNSVSPAIEVMNSDYLGSHGHIAIKTNAIDCAIADLARKGFAVNMETAKYKGEQLVAVYLKQELGGFSIQLLQK